MGVGEMKLIAAWIGRVVDHRDNAAAIAEVRAQVADLTAAFPLPQFSLTRE